MTDLEKQVLELLKEKPLMMQEMADLLHVEKSFLYQNALKQLLGSGKCSKMEKSGSTFYGLSWARYILGDADTSRDAFKDNYSINNISLNKTPCLNKEQRLNTNTVLDNRTVLDTNTDTGVLRGNQYPTDPEEVVKAAKESGYIMSLKEAAKFFAVYAAIGWIDRNGFPIRSWRALLPVWQLNQTPEQLANARKEHERREQGLPPIDPEEKEWEYYVDAQGRKWRKRPDESEWEHVPELITFADGLISEKGVL